MMRLVKNLNQDWLFMPEKVALTTPDTAFEKITLPHTNKLFSGTFVDNTAYQFVSTYRKHFSLPAEAVGQQVFIDFDGAMLKSEVYLNGQLLGKYEGGFTPFSYDITPYLVTGDNILTVYVDGTEDKRIPPYGNLVDFLTFGGLYRDVHLRMVDPCHLVSVFARPTLDTLACDLQLSTWSETMQIEAVLQDAQGQVIARHIQPVAADKFTLTFPDLPAVAPWTLDQPTLYDLALVLSAQGQIKDQTMVRLGFREAEFRADGAFYLNGEPIKLFGLNRHQTYPYIGAAAPARLQRLDADIIKYELGCNIVRTSHYVQSPHFLDRCDEIGLLVFEEIPGWQFIGDETWQKLVLRDVQAMIERDRNHPAIMLWGVRINESPDHEALYTQTNALAHALDPTRQTGGVRTFMESQRLEDVFTLNDFPEGLQTPRSCPHLITEFGGHMFPTKSWDHEERRIAHALKHAEKHSLQMGHPEVAGAIGWCAFDYHTHREFGSGDRICYHGVMDIYRLPKLAAYFYRSQKSPQQEIVLQTATNWTMGDRSGGGNNPLTVFSNCEEIEVFIGRELQGRFYPDERTFPHLKHPPFTVRWPEPYNPWGTEFQDLTVKGYIQGEQVAEHRIAADHLPVELRLSTHTATLKADGIDMARLVVQVVDRYGNILPYQHRLVTLTLTGQGTLLGDNPLMLLGGQAAVYLKSGCMPGETTITAQTPGLPPVSLKVMNV